MAAPPETGHPLRFGDFVFDRRSLELRSGGHVVHLQQQPAQVLAVLIARAGEIVTRDELRQAVWCTDTHMDFDRGLNYCINQIRAALGDAADAPRYLETLRGRGYRFTGNLLPVVDAPEASPARPIGLLALAAALALVATAGWWALAPGRTTPSAPAIGVGPFSASAGDEAWAGALRTALVARLARDLRVPVVDLAARGDTVVPWRVEGRVDTGGERLQITVMLRDGQTGLIRWSDVFDAPAGDRPADQARLSEVIAQAVRMAVEGPSAQPAGP
jgi:DNA-binding winged helix-turn-helix (wHTH) protein/TolB-like protein